MGGNRSDALCVHWANRNVAMIWNHQTSFAERSERVTSCRVYLSKAFGLLGLPNHPRKGFGAPLSNSVDGPQSDPLLHALAPGEPPQRVGETETQRNGRESNCRVET